MKKNLIRNCIVACFLFVSTTAISRPVDLVIVFDTTSSMGSYLEEMKQRAVDTVRQVRERSGDDVRLALVKYGDFEDGEGAFSVTPFSRPSSLDGGSSLETLMQDLESWDVSGGGDFPEDQLYGLEIGIELWVDDNGGGRRTNEEVLKAVVTITDAPIKDPDQDGRTSQSIADFAESVDPAHIYPIVVGGDPSAVEHAKLMADLTNGAMVEIDSADGLETALLDVVDKALETNPRTRKADNELGRTLTFLAVLLIWVL
jgi:hypothetical protein